MNNQELSIYIYIYKTKFEIGFVVVCVQIIHQKPLGKNSQLNTRSSLYMIHIIYKDLNEENN